MSRIDNFEYTRGGGEFGSTGEESKDGEEGHEKTEFTISTYFLHWLTTKEDNESGVTY